MEAVSPEQTASLVVVTESPEPASPPAKAPPPELVMREVVLADTRMRLPAWLVISTIISLVLCTILTLGLLLSLRQMRMLRRELAASRDVTASLASQLDQQSKQIQHLNSVMGGLAGDVKALDAGPELFAEEGESVVPDEGEPQPGENPRGRIVPGLPNGSLPGGWWSGGF
jgi:hypothetical protein